MATGQVLDVVLAGLGVGFLVASARVLVDWLRYRRRRATALVVWPGSRPRFHALGLFVAIALGVLVAVKLLVLRLPLANTFGETMMLLYFAVAVPGGRRIVRGVYQDGIWTDSSFVPFAHIGGMSWHDGRPARLLVGSRHRQVARSLLVPAAHQAEVRRLLRERIGAHDIHFAGEALDLGGHDEREDV